MKSSSWFHNLHRRAHAFTSGSDVTTLLGVHRCSTFGSDVTARHIASSTADMIETRTPFFSFVLVVPCLSWFSWSGTHSIICLPPSRLIYFNWPKPKRKIWECQVYMCHMLIGLCPAFGLRIFVQYSCMHFTLSPYQRQGSGYTITREDAWEKGSSQALSVRQLDPRTLPVDLSARIGRELLLT